MLKLRTGVLAQPPEGTSTKSIFDAGCALNSHLGLIQSKLYGQKLFARMAGDEVVRANGRWKEISGRWEEGRSEGQFASNYVALSTLCIEFP